MSTQERILSQSDELFMRYGVRSVTMNDIASKLGISKKTIYQYFSNKAEIVTAVSYAHVENEKKAAEHITQQAENAIHELVLIIQWMRKTFASMSPNVIYEIQKYYPEAWKAYDSFKSDFVMQKVKENLIQGIKEKYYRPEINIEIISRIRIAQMDAGFQEDIFPHDQFDTQEVQIQIFELYMHGIVTRKGRKLLEQYFSRQ